MNRYVEMLRPVPLRELERERGIVIDRETLATLLQLLATFAENKAPDPQQDELTHMALIRLSLTVCDLLHERRASGNG